MLNGIETKLLLEPLDVAAMLSISVSKLNKLRHYGGGPVYSKIGRKVLYPYQEIVRYIDALPKIRNTGDKGLSKCLT